MQQTQLLPCKQSLTSSRTPTLLGSLLRAEQGVGQLQERAVHEVAKQLGVDERVVGAAAIAAEAALSGGAASARRLSSRADCVNHKRK